DPAAETAGEDPEETAGGDADRGGDDAVDQGLPGAVDQLRPQVGPEPVEAEPVLAARTRDAARGHLTRPLPGARGVRGEQGRGDGDQEEAGDDGQAHQGGRLPPQLPERGPGDADARLVVGAGPAGGARRWQRDGHDTRTLGSMIP